MRAARRTGSNACSSNIKRRPLAIRAFPDRASALRLITAVALQTTSIWRDRIYLDMSAFDVHDTVAA